MVEMAGDLLGAAAGGEVLGAVQRRAPFLGREVQEILGHLGHRAPRALLPRRVGRGVNDDLTHDAPARVMGLAASDEEARERFGEDGRVRLGASRIQVTQRFADVAAISNGARELTRGPAGSTRGADWQLRAHLHWRIELQARRGRPWPRRALNQSVVVTTPVSSKSKTVLLTRRPSTAPDQA
jgi:hypothetical protein